MSEVSGFSECQKGFYHLSRAWYGDANLRGSDVVDEICFGYYHPDGGTCGEMAFRWKQLSSRPTAMLVVFEDAWAALHSLGDVIQRMAELDEKHPSPQEVRWMLLSCGFVDLTEVENPHGVPVEKESRDYAKPSPHNKA